MERNIVGWLEIPATDLDRASTFYEAVFGYTLERSEFGGMPMAMFPWDHEKPGSAGCLIQNESYVPSTSDGVLIYFSAISGDLSNELSKVEEAGGKVLTEKSPIGEHGFIGVFIDTEGNKVAMHSMK